MLNAADNLFSSNPGPLMMDRRWKANIETAPNCPRCASTNTKFCYYNNYSLSQPRYFCKGCRRYWTKGGSLRNVPLGGGCRKTRRSKSARTPSTGSSYDSISDGSSDDQLSGRKSGSDIDLAAVFSKFLSNSQESSNSFSSSSYSNSNSPGSDSGLVLPGNQNQYYDPARQENPVLGMDVLNGGFGAGQSFDSGLETGLDGLQALLNDAEIDQEMPNFWSETAELPDISWQQQQQQLQGFDGLVMEEEHSIFPNNILNGNWNSIDILPSYGA